MAVASARVDFNVLVFVVAVVVTGTVTMCTTSTKCRKSTLSGSHIGTRLDCNANGREAVFLLVVMLPEPSLRALSLIFAHDELRFQLSPLCSVPREIASPSSREFSESYP